ncbi:MAG: serine/threonine protein kinase, partial [Myxococcales bacterium]|nr:serine/threonine protein kinase [Myxococcales bacterium]
MSEELGRTTVQEPTRPESRRRRAARRRAPTPVIGSTVGRYLVLEHLGRGAMGHVVRAYDPKLQREVAIKLVSNTILDHDARDRMLREARAMAQLSHPNVVAVYDAEDSETGVMLVMEYVPGQTLRAWTRSSAHPWGEIVGRFVEAGRGLAAAHATGLLHRDFKADNVLVAESGRVRVTDFGLAKLATSADARLTSDALERSHDGPEVSTTSAEIPSGAALDSALTQAGTVMGTPRYMAPEQHRGEALAPAADQYAFCVALWEALVGVAPFQSTTLYDLLADKLQGAPPWPSSAPRLPRPVLEALERGLQPDPRDRWPSMDALLEGLAHDPSRRRNRWLAALGGLGLVGLGLGGWQSWARGRAARCSGAAERLAGAWDDERRARVREALLGVDASYAAAVWTRTEAALDQRAADWARTYTEVCAATTIRGEQSTAVMDLRMACLHRAREELEAAVDVLAHADAEVAGHADVLVDSLALRDRCSDVEALQAEVAPPPPEEAKAVQALRRRLAEAKAQREAGRYAPALVTVGLAEQALAALRYEPVAAEVALERGRVLHLLARFDEAERALRQALESASRWRRLDLMQESAAELMVVVGAEQWHPAEGLQLRELAVGLAAGDPRAEAEARRDLAAVLGARGDYAQAEAEYRRALELYAQALGPEHADLAATRSGLAVVLDQRGKHE